MTARISVLLANLDHYNLGMLSMDLAAYGFFRRKFYDAKVSYYWPGAPNREAEAKAELPFSCGDALTSLDEIAASDKIVFWGDFQHPPPVESPGRWMYIHHGAKSPEEGLNLYYKNRFFEDLSTEFRSKIVIFGTSIVTNVASDYQNARYSNNLATLFNDARLVALRDIHSAISATHRTGNYGKSHLGCDPALLLDQKTVDELTTTIGQYYEPPGDPQKYAAVFLGRTRGMSEYRQAARFVQRYCRAAGKIPVWIPWIPRRNAYHEHVLYRPIGRRGWGDAIGDLLGSFQHFGMAITDTYHFAINAWRSGIPAICIGRGAPGFVKEVDEKKKEMFYRMYDAGELYVFREHLKSRRQLNAVVDRVRTALEEKQAHAIVLQNIRAHASACEKSVLKSLTERPVTTNDVEAGPTVGRREKAPANPTDT